MVLTMEQYLAIRFKDVGVYPTQFICGLHLSIPENVFTHPAVGDVMRLACELIIIDNVSASNNNCCFP